jgi:hypothetical protein
MTMSNGGRCCLLGICCRRTQQITHITKDLVSEGLDEEQARKAATWFADEIESLGDLEEAVKKMKKEHRA